MRVIIFNDTQNFNGSLNFINKRFKRSEKRFWNYKKYIQFLLNKVKSKNYFKDRDLQLKKVYFYEGKYSSNMLSDLKWSCHRKIKELNALIAREHQLLNIISQERNIARSLRKKINNHVDGIKRELEDNKKSYFTYLDKQLRNFEGQKKLFEELKGNQLIELRQTPLKQNNGEVHQKGVDVLLATDLVHLAHTDAYDLAIILSGDTDLIEAVKLIRKLGKKVVIISYHTPRDPSQSNISDLISTGKFINLRDFTDEEILAMSELREKVVPNEIIEQAGFHEGDSLEVVDIRKGEMRIRRKR